MNQYKKTGYYTMLHPGTNLRIIGLNPLLVDSGNPYLWKNSTNKWGFVRLFVNIVNMGGRSFKECRGK